MNKRPHEANLVNKKVKLKIDPKQRNNELDKVENERRSLMISDPNSNNYSNSETTI